MRYGLAGLAVPLATAVVTNAIRIVRRKPVVLAPFRWQVLGVAFGIGSAMLETRHRDQVVERAEREREADAHRAWLAGQNDVAMGADSIVDDLCRISPLLGDQSADASVGPMVRAWKEALADTTEVGAVYLGNALAQWRRRHNDFQPDLSADVWFELAPGDGTVILTSGQAEWLADRCDRLPLVGGVPVTTVATGRGRRPGMRLELRIGDNLVEVPDDVDDGVRSFDVGPIALAMGAFWAFDTTTSANSRCARAAVWPLVAAGGAAAVYAHRQVERHGDDAHGAIVAVTCAWSVAMAVSSSLSIGQSTGPDGRQHLPFLTGPTVLGSILPLYWRDLDRDQRLGAVAAIAATCGLGASLYPEDIVGGDLARELLLIAAATFTGAGLRRSLDRSVTSIRSSLAEQWGGVLEQSFADGRSFVIRLVAEARYALQRQLVRSADIDPRLAGEAQRRLDDVDRRLSELRR